MLILLNNLTQSLKKRVKQTINLLLLDITMAVALQLLFAKQFQYFVISINELLAILASLLIYHQLQQSYKLIGLHPKLAECHQFQQIYGNYYEGLNTNNKFGYQYNFIYYIRKVLYTFFLVFCYYNSILQTTLCFLTFATGVMLLLYRNPYQTRRQFIQQFMQEFSVGVILLITILFAFNDQTQRFSSNTEIKLGWVMIAFILLSLFAEILTLIFEIIVSIFDFLYTNYKLIHKAIKKIQQKPSMQQQQAIQDPPVVNVNEKKVKFNDRLHWAIVQVE